MSLSPDGNFLLTNAMDNTLRVWDVRPYAPADRCDRGCAAGGWQAAKVVGGFAGACAKLGARHWDSPDGPARRRRRRRCMKIFTGHQHTFERTLLRCAWSPDGKRVTAGSADRIVYIWDAATLQLAYALPGHKGSVNEVVFHPEVRAGVAAGLGGRAACT